MSIQDRIAAAFKNSDKEYMKKCLLQRNPGPEALGSRFLSEQTIESLCALEWEELSHPDVQAPAVAFQAKLPGLFGMAQIEGLASGTVLTLDDRKGTGFLTPTIEGIPFRETEVVTLLVGPGDQGEEVWTFFPGLPVKPSTLKVEKFFDHGTEITKEDAMDLGLVWAKIE